MSWTCTQLRTGTSSINRTRPTFSRTDITWTGSFQSCLQKTRQYLRYATGGFLKSAAPAVSGPAVQCIHQLSSAQNEATMACEALHQVMWLFCKQSASMISSRLVVGLETQHTRSWISTSMAKSLPVILPPQQSSW